MYIAAGHLVNDDTSTQLNYTVVDTFVHPLYTNDIALIKVAEMLPVNAVVPIPRVEDSRDNCSVIVRNNSPESADYFKIVPNLRIAPKEYCGILDNEPDDWCSQYQMGADWCQATAAQLYSIDDLGSSLICNNVFRGVLSNIVLPLDQFNFPCGFPRTTFARYTSLEENEDWLYQIMGRKPAIPTEEDDDDSAAAVATPRGILIMAVIAAVLLI